MMRYIFAMFTICFATSAFIVTNAFVPADAFAQQGTLQGGRLVLTGGGAGGSNTVTVVPAAITTPYTITLPNVNPASLTGLQFLGNDGLGNCFWGIPVSPSGGGQALYEPSGSEPFHEPNNGDVYTINLGYSGGSGNAVGALINVVANGPSNTLLMGLLDTARNIYTGKVTWDNAAGSNNGQPDELAGSDTATLAATGASGTAIGIQVSATGGGNNYAAITKGGSVGIGITADSSHTDSLEVHGNVLISGQNGLKIQEGTNACMGTTTLNGTTAVTVSTTKVSATSRILLTIQSPSGTVGTPYVSLQTSGTSFQIKSTTVGDNSTVAWMILLP
jgi:hypothetical protein